ncbi:Prop-1-like homeobox protein [Planoprotostelium fungivorum]|uniref:Prop-1-like homeobox protein n=1 Tax=Planoprotostelium fungivorum TaxID=1890364 RepID=A0A2P6NG57_9EUKA|nr:Prop-1-like homeobox protein [Planoprotostelium fungivorum]
MLYRQEKSAYGIIRLEMTSEAFILSVRSGVTDVPTESDSHSVFRLYLTPNKLNSFRLSYFVEIIEKLRGFPGTSDPSDSRIDKRRQLPQTLSTPNMNITQLITSSESPFDVCSTGGKRCMGRTFFFAPSRAQVKTIFSYEQRDQLMREYKQQPYPTMKKRRELAEEMKTTVRSIQIWFQNRRQRTDRKRMIGQSILEGNSCFKAR